ncbi:MAG: CRISPR-associated protein Cas4 [Deltaproteobacteria bacterium]|nr:CRISPR-associated protein Cas4 [Deltaproteobacteria bacterium]
MAKKINNKWYISASELGDYVFCPESWRLKRLEKATPKDNQSSLLGQEEHKEWISNIEVFLVLNRMLRLGIIAFTFVILIAYFIEEVNHRLVLTFLGLSAVFTAFSFIVDKYLEKKRSVGLETKFKNVKASGSTELISHSLRIYGTPDAILNENGNLVPVERKSFAKKLKSRYIVQLAAYMLLAEETYKTNVPFGYIIMGDKRKRRTVYNSPGLRKLVKRKSLELINALEGLNKLFPDPHPRKCSKCNVSHICQFKAC